MPSRVNKISWTKEEIVDVLERKENIKVKFAELDQKGLTAEVE